MKKYLHKKYPYYLFVPEEKSGQKLRYLLKVCSPDRVMICFKSGSIFKVLGPWYNESEILREKKRFGSRIIHRAELPFLIS